MKVQTDVVVIGGGLIGCATAVAVADRHASVVMIVAQRPGSASAAAAGMLAPSIERAARTAEAFALASRAAFPDFVRSIEERSRMEIPLQRRGILEIALDDGHASELRSQLAAGVTWLNDREVHELEPHVAATAGGVLWQEDGSVDNVTLLHALWRLIREHQRITVLDAGATAIRKSGDSLIVSAGEAGNVAAGRVVLAAGAWSGTIEGAPCAAVVTPMRGQIAVLDRATVTRPVYSDDRYIVPRGRHTLAGSTMENVGFDPTTSESAVAALVTAACRLSPQLEGAAVDRAWAGLRPVTPDLLPLIGPDPDTPALIYACGHSRNGVLMAPTTAAVVKELVFEESLTFDLSQFRPDRFSGTFRR